MQKSQHLLFPNRERPAHVCLAFLSKRHLDRMHRHKGRRNTPKPASHIYMSDSCESLLCPVRSVSALHLGEIAATLLTGV